MQCYNGDWLSCYEVRQANASWPQQLKLLTLFLQVKQVFSKSAKAAWRQIISATGIKRGWEPWTDKKFNRLARGRVQLKNWEASSRQSLDDTASGACGCSALTPAGNPRRIATWISAQAPMRHAITESMRVSLATLKWPWAWRLILLPQVRWEMSF